MPYEISTTDQINISKEAKIAKHQNVVYLDSSAPKWKAVWLIGSVVSE